MLVLPALKLFGLAQDVAIPTANLYSVLVKAHAGLEHWKLDTIRRRTALWFLVGGVPTDIAVTLVMRMVKAGGHVSPASLEGFLRWVVVSVMIVTGLVVVYNFITQRNKKDHEYYTPPDVFPASRQFTAILWGMMIGLLIGGTSIGGGVLVIPILAIFFGLSPKNTVGTSVAISIFLALVSALFFFVGNPEVNYSASVGTAVIMFVGAIPGVRWGSRLSVRIPNSVLKTIVVVLILAAIVGMLVAPGKGH